VVPFLKVVNDTAVAVNRRQAQRRRLHVSRNVAPGHRVPGLRKNTGDDAAAHDMNTANWIPDLFMKRVIEGGNWTLFSPPTPRPATNGDAFEKAYINYETLADKGQIKSQAHSRGAALAEMLSCCSRRATRG
jgi:ribonucleoside-diphosphate reductase alpha chain